MEIKYRPITQKVQKVRTLALDNEPELQAVILTPDKYNYLTQANDVDVMERVILTEVTTLSTDFDANAWKEITEEEADKIMKAQSARFNLQKEYYTNNTYKPNHSNNG